MQDLNSHNRFFRSGWQRRGLLWTLGKIGSHLRFTFITGVFIIVPVIVTYFVLRLIFDFLDGLLSPIAVRLVRRDVPGLGLVALILLIYLSGLTVGNFMGRRVIELFQRALLRVPVVRSVYSAAKQLVESFSGSPATGFKRVVAIEYPRIGLWCIGFMTGLTEDEEHRKLAVIYIPTAPLPNSGWVAVVPVDEVYDTDMTVQTAMQFTLSGGILAPLRIVKRALPEAMVIEAEFKPPREGSHF